MNVRNQGIWKYIEWNGKQSSNRHIRVSTTQANTAAHNTPSLLWLWVDLLSRCVQSDCVQLVLTGARLNEKQASFQVVLTKKVSRWDVVSRVRVGHRVNNTNLSKHKANMLINKHERGEKALTRQRKGGWRNTCQPSSPPTPTEKKGGNWPGNLERFH